MNENPVIKREFLCIRGNKMVISYHLKDLFAIMAKYRPKGCMEFMQALTVISGNMNVSCLLSLVDEVDGNWELCLSRIYPSTNPEKPEFNYQLNLHFWGECAIEGAIHNALLDDLKAYENPIMNKNAEIEVPKKTIREQAPPNKNPENTKADADSMVKRFIDRMNDKLDRPNNEEVYQDEQHDSAESSEQEDDSKVTTTVTEPTPEPAPEPEPAPKKRGRRKKTTDTKRTAAAAEAAEAKKDTEKVEENGELVNEAIPLPDKFPEPQSTQPRNFLDDVLNGSI